MNTQQAEAIKTLTKAKSLINRGWVKENLYVKKGYTVYVGDDEYIAKTNLYCALGAIKKADGPGEEGAITLIKQAIRIFTGKTPFKRPENAKLRHIFEFNDSKDTTKEDVLAAFDKALELAQTEEGTA